MKLHLNYGEIDGKRVLSEKVVKEMYEPQIEALAEGPEAVADEETVAYCLGWLATQFHGRPILRHGGGDFGASTRIVLDHDARLGVAVTTSLYPPVFIAISYGLLEHFTGHEITDWTVNVNGTSKPHLQSI